MRNTAFMIALLALAACGPNSKAIATAKTAHYKGDKLVLFNAAKDAAAAKYPILKSDETALSFQTEARWYTSEGLSATVRSNDMRDVPDKSINVSLVVDLVPDGDEYIVHVKPLMLRRLADSPMPQKLSEDDPSVPGWATGKVDQLALAIHDALKPYEVTGGPQMIPAGPGTAPAPEEGSGAATPGAGSAAAAPAPAPAPAP
jgi:hypothetical protein